MPRLPRRSLVACVGALPLAWVFSRHLRAEATPLVPDPDGILDLLEGFSYTILQRRFADMDDGYRVPDKCDGMACFDGTPTADGRATLVLMRNHELEGNQIALGPCKDGQAPPAEAYNRNAPGGVTRLVLDRETLEPLSSNLVLTGTLRNCSGGLSPWGWLSCEEIVIDGHGYVFVCRTDAATVQPAKPIRGYGRFRHEAAHVDPSTHIAYLTEDEPVSALYRFVPRGADPFDGTLQAMAVKRAPRASLTNMEIGQRLDVAWVPVDDPEGTSVRVGDQARALGAAVVVRGEGLWLHDDAVYFCATEGGPFGAGQIFKLHPEGDEGVLELVAIGSSPDLLRCPDNIAVHPDGGIVVAEDGPGGDCLRGIDVDGRPFDFARNVKSDGELAGVCFDPSGSVMFVNLYEEGLTLAIRGPVRSLFSAKG
ncbi:MAG: DUF839 domain-containing protein [Polyangiaceae bacterium]|nr:DUF839 domain-containing protein [Polyangiaceae bacterium]